MARSAVVRVRHTTALLAGADGVSAMSALQRADYHLQSTGYERPHDAYGSRARAKWFDWLALAFLPGSQTTLLNNALGVSQALAG